RSCARPRSKRALGAGPPGGAVGDGAGLVATAHDERPAAVGIGEEFEREAAILFGTNAQGLAEALAQRLRQFAIAGAGGGRRRAFGESGPIRAARGRRQS